MAVINYITQIQFGYGSLDSLQQECERLGIKRPLVVTDKGVRAAGIVDKVIARLGGGTPGIFDETPANPNEQAVRKATEIFRAGGHDGIIAVGGGSSIDLAKGVAVCARHDGPLASFALVEGGIGRITAATAPVIAIPTTAGTGSEVGRGAVLILDDGRKVGVISPHVVPKVAICDPELTLALPPMLTAAPAWMPSRIALKPFLRRPSIRPPTALRWTDCGAPGSILQPRRRIRPIAMPA